MNTSKLLVAALIAAAITSAPDSLANDTEAQIKAREALNQKLNELNAQQRVTPPDSAPTQPKPAAPVAPPKPAPAPAPVTRPAPAPATAVAPPAPVQPPPAEIAVPPAEDPAVVAARQAALQKALDEETFSAVPPPSSPGKATASQVEIALPEPKPELAKPTAKPAKMEPPNASQFKPVEAPALPMNMDKQSRLAELLRKYRADEITPEQYHAERAKVLAAP